MADQIDSRTPPTAAQILEWQRQDLVNREAKRASKEKPTEFSRPPLAKKEGPGRASLTGSAYQPGRSNLPPNVFGYKPEARNPEDILIDKEERNKNF